MLQMKMWSVAAALACLSIVGCRKEEGAMPTAPPRTSFESFDQRARNGERLNVVFFGASLTWGANATDPQTTSYRAQFADWLEQKYPKAHFRFTDAAIGGTGSQLGVFRFDRDVLRHKPDLVLLDFSANDDIYSDDPENGASYESLVRRTILDAKSPIIILMFPFQWNVSQGNTDGMKRRDMHIRIAQAYNAPYGDAITLCQERVKSGAVKIAQIWPADGVHPGNLGYRLFAEAAGQAFDDGLAGKLVCSVPERMLFADTYMTNARVRISSLGPLPEGWRTGTPNLTSAWYDGLMSRWLDDEVIASNVAEIKKSDGKTEKVYRQPGRIKVKFNAAVVLLFGEETMKSGKYRTWLDGKLMEYPQGQNKPTLTEIDAAGLRCGGNRQHVWRVGQGLDTAVDHVLEIEPVFASDVEQELRLESICVAGGKAAVTHTE